MDLGDWSVGVNGRDVDRCIGHFVLDKITGAANQVHIGVLTGSVKNLIGYTVSTIDLNAWNTPATALQVTTQPGFPNWGGYKLGYVSTPNGHYLQCLASLTSSARTYIYKDGFFELYGANSAMTAKTAPSIPYFLGALNNNGTASNFSARTFGSVYFSRQRFSIHHASRSIDLCNLETQFQKDLGRY